MLSEVISEVARLVEKLTASVDQTLKDIVVPACFLVDDADHRVPFIGDTFKLLLGNGFHIVIVNLS